MRKWAGFFLVVAITLFARAYGAAAESVWYDEAVTVRYLNEPTLSGFLHASSEFDRLKVPLYLIIEYGWWHAVGPSVLGLRFLSILIAVATVSTLYWCCLRAWGGWTALVASLYFAVSKVLIYYGQEIRMYGLVCLLALASWFALYAAVRGKRGAWIVHAVLNLLLVQTHLLGAFSFAAQFIFLLTIGPRNWRRLTAWLAAHGLFVLTIVPWVLNSDDIERGSSWIAAPGVVTLANTYVFEYTGARFADNATAPVVSALLVAGIVLLSFPLFVLGVRSLWRTNALAAKLLLCWLFLPPLIMFVLSYFIRPCYVDRYALYAVFPFLIFTGHGVASLRTLARPAAALALAMLCIANAFAVERPIRADMAGAADIVRFNREPGDRIVARGMGYRHCIEVYLPDADDTGAVTKTPIRRTIKDVAKGQRTWYILDPDPSNKDYSQWAVPIDEAVAAGEVRIAVDKYTGGRRPIRVLLLTEAEAK